MWTWLLIMVNRQSAFFTLIGTTPFWQPASFTYIMDLTNPPDLSNILSYMKDLRENSCHGFALYKPCFCFLQSTIEHFATWICALNLDCNSSSAQINAFYFYHSLIFNYMTHFPRDTGHAIIKYSKLAKLPLSWALMLYRNELHYIHVIYFLIST